MDEYDRGEIVRSVIVGYLTVKNVDPRCRRIGQSIDSPSFIVSNVEFRHCSNSRCLE